MKNQLLAVSMLMSLFLGAGVGAQAKVYYISTAGSDANNGLSVLTPWKTIGKLNASFSIITAGDSVLFKRDDVFFGAITITKSGTITRPIVFGAYGSGAKPLITGLVQVSGWTALGNGVYQAATPLAKTNLNMVTLDGRPVALGRYPNATDVNGGFLSYESFSGTSSITDNQLNSDVNWTGAEVVIRKKLWVLDRCKVTNHVGGTVSYTNTSNSTYDGTNGYGYFFQNDPRTLDQKGEWYYSNNRRYLQMYFGSELPSNFDVKVSAFDTLFSINARNYISINDLAFEGSNGMTVYVTNSTGFTVQNCDMSNAGLSGITVQNTGSTIIENCTTYNMLNNGISVNNTKVSPTSIRNCSIRNSGAIPGMGLSNGNSYKAMLVSASNLVVEYNKIDTAGYVGLEFQGSNVLIKNNVIDHYCYIKDDGAGIYTYTYGTDQVPGTIYTNRVVKENIVMNGVGAPNGRSSSSVFVSGIYLDGRTMNVDVLNNTVYNNGKNGIHCNNPININFRGNTSFDNLNAMSISRWATTGGISNLSIKNNIFYPANIGQRCLMYTNTALNVPVVTTFESTVRALGDIDSNYYSMVNPTGFNFEYYLTTGGAGVPASPLSFEGWRNLSTHDAASKIPVRTPVLYKLSNRIGSNKVSNGVFTSVISGVTIYGANVLGAWDNTSKINGGSLRVTFSAPAANKYALLHSPVGSISSAKKYVLRFSTYGTSSRGIVRAYIRKTSSPFNNLVPTQVKTFGMGITNHEVLFDSPISETAGSIVLEIEQNSGTTYIDNIDLYEANATVNSFGSQIRFEYNPNKTSATIPLDGVYVGVDGRYYFGSITLDPFMSSILVRDTGLAPKGALKVSANTAAVKCFGGTSTVTISASGGYEPYTGVGVFNVTAGTYNYVVTDVSGASSSVSVTVTQPNASLLASSATTGALVGAGESTIVTVAATGGVGPYTGTGAFPRPAGTYNFTVTDANGCTSVTTITIAEGTPVSTEFKATANALVEIGCFNGMGSVQVEGTGGTAPYSGTGSMPVTAGRGSLKVSSRTNSVGVYTALYHAIGPVSSDKTYVIKFSTIGSSTAGNIRVGMRQTGRPWATFTAKQPSTFGRIRKDHAFIIRNPTSQTAASYLIEIEQSAGATFIDNIAVFESTSDGTPIGSKLNTDGQFEKDIVSVFSFSSNGNHRLEWDTAGRISNTHYFTVTDATNAISVVQVGTSQPAVPLTVNVTAGVQDVLTGLLPVTVNATGGTAPYVGTGFFPKTPGIYNFTVTDANGCSTISSVDFSGGIIGAKSAPAASKTAPQARRAAPAVAAVDRTVSFNAMAYPNPSSGNFSLVVEGGTNEKVSIQVFGFDGRQVFQSFGTSNNRYSFGSNFIAGVYTVKVMQGASVKTLKLVKVNQ